MHECTLLQRVDFIQILDTTKGDPVNDFILSPKHSRRINRPLSPLIIYVIQYLRDTSFSLPCCSQRRRKLSKKKNSDLSG